MRIALCAPERSRAHSIARYAYAHALIDDAAAPSHTFCDQCEGGRRVSDTSNNIIYRALAKCPQHE
eukprot:6203728-Pleurochrysis_carterae.AAC.1